MECQWNGARWSSSLSTLSQRDDSERNLQFIYFPLRRFFLFLCFAFCFPSFFLYICVWFPFVHGEEILKFQLTRPAARALFPFPPLVSLFSNVAGPCLPFELGFLPTKKKLRIVWFFLSLNKRNNSQDRFFVPAPPRKLIHVSNTQTIHHRSLNIYAFYLRCYFSLETLADEIYYLNLHLTNIDN